MSWNYRIVRRSTDREGRATVPFMAIHEAYYDDELETERPQGVTENPVVVGSESVEGLRQVLKMMEHAFDKPVLEWEDFCSSTD